MVTKIFLFLVLLTNFLDVENAEILKYKVKYLEPGTTIHYEPLAQKSGLYDNSMRIYCYKGNTKNLQRMFETIEIQLDIENDNYMQYEGETPEQVRQNYEDRQSLFSLSLFSQKRSRLSLSPFQQRCIGIETVNPYRVHLHQLQVDHIKLMQAILGIFVFVYAAKLSRNTAFYYMTGVLLGICFSFILLLWLFSKVLPRKTMMYGTLVGGSAIGLYLVQFLWQNLQTVVLTYRNYVLWYLASTGVISFFFCYRWGPPKDERSRNIIRWCLQLVALLLIYSATLYEEAGAAAVFITAFIYYFPTSLLRRFRSFYNKIFPPKRRLLTLDEYNEQGIRETKKALEELRAYASSPECNQWKTMSRLKNPRRFAAFVEGASHINDREKLGHTNDSDSEIDFDMEEERKLGNQSYSRHQRGYSNSRRIVHNNDYDNEDENDQEIEYTNESYRHRDTRNPPYTNSFGSRVSHLRNGGISSPNYPDSPHSSINRRRTPSRTDIMLQRARESKGTTPSRSRLALYDENSDMDE